MKVFLSWSGEKTKSHAVAKALDDWLPTVLNAVEPWVSSRGLVAGLQWNQQLDKELDDTTFGIIVVTPWNQHSQWLNFEAGALSKRVGGAEARVAPLLVDFPNVAKLTGPLSSYQVVLPTNAGIHSLVVSINEALGDAARKFDALERAFDVCWPSLEAKLKKIDVDFPSEADPATAPSPLPAAADGDDMLSEILTAVRGLARSDARLRSEIRQNAANRPDPDRVPRTHGVVVDRPLGALTKRIAHEITTMGHRVEAIRRGPNGQVTVKLSQRLSDEQQKEVVDGLDWERLHINSLYFDEDDLGDESSA
ncbi:toll/interleukin-1 receptor domain-containing protein [Arthrobacter sp. H16F315]|uniref:toll/interleukin-1 receptor domain-containing protein n=1 Tax=Arthrobacter sp. H16F315 TaxID=2955314 RepID=UPI0020980E95|nr:toll/interleukin-1 receptor domain-containing protein [Arthrobacter sp. H16F315]MDD1477075.1 toll/interleukin-1 receptor domain-containing protein [Arthrobacter sp. H16F315]